MSDITYRTGSENITHYLSVGSWKGQPVLVEEILWSEYGPCVGHELDVMTYYGEDMGSLWCQHCCGVVTQAARQKAEADATA